MVWLKDKLLFPIKWIKKWRADRKFKKRIKELQEKDPFIYK
jgi:hypothetical protein|tara:strand:- start:3850 stop:3972 length:123 start_codon:yes stop_codon:yes gene_type:complete